MNPHHMVYLAAFVVLPVFWLLPIAALFALVRFEARRGGPWILLHIPLNAAHITWSYYAVEVLREDAHGPNSPFIIIPRLFLIAVFYVALLPKLVDDIPSAFQPFRYAAAAVNLVACYLIGAAFVAVIG